MKKHIILSALAAFLMSFGVMSCATDSTPENSNNYAAKILSEDSVENPDPALVDAYWLADTLNLTDSQVVILTAAYDSLRAIAEAEIEAANGDEELIKAAIKKYREAMRAVVVATLTPEQLALLDSLRAPFHSGKGTRGHHFGQKKHAYRDSVMLVKLAEELELTDSQIVQMQALADSIKAGQPGNGKQAFYEGMKAILTEEQFAEFREWIGAQPDRIRKGKGPGNGKGHGKR